MISCVTQKKIGSHAMAELYETRGQAQVDMHPESDGSGKIVHPPTNPGQEIGSMISRDVTGVREMENEAGMGI